MNSYNNPFYRSLLGISEIDSVNSANINTQSLTVSSLGTGLVSSTSGTLQNAIVGTGLDYDTRSNTLSNQGVTSLIAGATGPVTLSNSTGDVIISLPQNLQTTSSPTFSNLTLNLTSGVLKASSTGLITSNATTDDLTEGKTNLYYTNARAQGAFSAGTNITLASGVISTVTNPTFDRLEDSSGTGTNTQRIGTSAGALYTGSRSVIIGTSAVSATTAVNNLVSVGYQSLSTCNAVNNTALGYRAGYVVTTGTNNTFLGNGAGGNGSVGSSITTGSSNIYVGYGNSSSTAGAIRETVIGILARGKGNDTAYIRADLGLYVSNLTTGVLKSSSAGLITSDATTDDLTEGITNQYFTTARARNSLSAGSGISYDSTTGIITSLSITGPTGPQGIQGPTGPAGTYTAGTNIAISGGNVISTITNPQFERILNSSLGSTNLLLGTSSGARLTTGGGNLLVGNSSGNAITTGTFNICLGVGCYGGSGTMTQSNAYNIAVGSNSLYSCTSTANNNIAVGFSALQTLTNGVNNCCVGNQSGQAIIGAINNTFEGSFSGYSCTSGQANTLIGYSSGYIISTGSNNSGLGYNTLQGLTTGSSNLHLGYNTQSSSSSVSNEIVIGSDNTTTVGKGTNTCFINSPSGLYSYMPAYGHFRSTNNTSNLMYWNTTLFNQNISVSNQTVTFALAGLYQIVFSGSIQASSGGAPNGQLTINGALYSSGLFAFYMTNSSTGSVYPLSFTIIYRMTAGSTMYMGTANIQGNVSIPSYLSITFIGL